MIRIVWSNLMPPGFEQEDIVEKLIIPAIFDNAELKDEIIHSTSYTRKTRDQRVIDFPTDLREDKTSKTRFFTYQKESVAITKRMISLLFLKTQHENVPYNMYTFPVRHVFKKQWWKILSEMNHDDETWFKNYIQLFWKEGSTPDDFIEQRNKKKFSRGTNNNQLIDVDVTFHYKEQEVSLENLLSAISCYDYSTSLDPDDLNNITLSEEDNVFFERLSTMSVIACIWYIWEEAKNDKCYAEQIVRLAAMLFPPEAIKHFIPANAVSNDSSESVFDNEDSLLAEQDLKKAEAYLASHQYQLAGELFETIYETYKYASDQIIGTALAHLVECCENNYRRPSRFASIDDIKKEAINYKCVYISKKKQTIKTRPEQSKANNSGLYTVNCNNLISHIIAETKPSGWEETISSTPASTLAPNHNQRMVLVSDDYNKNIQDALDILDTIKCSIDQNETGISDWKNFELYIRCNEDETTPLLDTALSYFTENTNQEHPDIPNVIRIFLIDEAKRSADFLFAKHPHFYPLTFERNRFEEKKTIHLVIVSNNPDHRYIKWLTKEGFWTLPRFDASVKTKITVISPNASEIGYSIITECPGLAGYSTIEGQLKGTPLPIDDIDFPSIDFRKTSFTDRSLVNELVNTLSTNDHLYYIVDAESDLKGIQLGITIRELSIKKAIKNYRINNYSKKNYVIAIRCSDASYSSLAQELIIPKEEEHANCWYNDYNFITWGSLQDLYAWDQLNGGIIESLAQSIHLQYSANTISHSEDDRQKQLASYFRRLYNHDSSFASALGIPYRLYEVDVIPRAWFIQNPDAWWNEQVRQELAKSFRQKLFPTEDGKPDEQLLTLLAQYEHMRWCCFQLTRGWLPVDDNQQVIQYMLAGVTRPSLQIAKLHPCICSWEDLESLYKALSDAALRKIDYQDLNNFKQTSPEEFATRISPYLDKKFKMYFAPDENYTYFQNLDVQIIKHTADILESR